MKGKISNPECTVLSMDPDYNNGSCRSISFDLIECDPNLFYIENDVEFESILPSGKSGIPVNMLLSDRDYIEQYVSIANGDVKKGNHLSYHVGQGMVATLFIGPEIFHELFDDLKRNIIPKNFSFEIFKFGFSDSCLSLGDDARTLKWDVTTVKTLNIWGVSFVY